MTECVLSISIFEKALVVLLRVTLPSTSTFSCYTMNHLVYYFCVIECILFLPNLSTFYQEKVTPQKVDIPTVSKPHNLVDLIVQNETISPDAYNLLHIHMQ